MYFLINIGLKKIIIIPGDNGINNRESFDVQISSKFKSVKRWTKLNNRDFDYGAMFLKNDSLYKKVKGFFEISLLYNIESTLYNSGYTDESGLRCEQWGDFGTPTEITSHIIYYNNNTEKGNSGSPITIIENDNHKVVGIHSYGNCPNYAVRINTNILKVWNEWKKIK